jgi:hypothetical protein
MFQLLQWVIRNQHGIPYKVSEWLENDAEIIDDVRCQTAKVSFMLKKKAFVKYREFGPFLAFSSETVRMSTSMAIACQRSSLGL